MEFEIEKTSMWSFKERGTWESHKGDYRGNWPPQVPRNLILKYTKEKDIVLDQFLGSGTTMIESKILNRKCIGCDINKDALSIAKERVEMANGNGETYLIRKDARDLKFITNNRIDFICMHPPYLDIIKYSNNLKDDLSLLSNEDFYKGIGKVAKESFRVLKKDKFCAIMVGDARKKGFIEPIGFKVLDIFLTQGFKLKEIIIKEQHNCKSTKYWSDKSEKLNFYLLAHEYIFIFKK